MSDLATIESAFYCSCDSEAVQGGLLSVDAALRKGLALAKTVDEMEQLPLEAAHGRVLGQAIQTKTPRMIADEPELLRQALENAAQKADLVVTTGGVSVGDEDHMPAMLAAAGGVLDVIKVAMKPGKPLTIGHLGNAVYIGLPGNPVSAFVTWHVIGARIAEKLAGLAISAPQRSFVRAGFARTRQPGRCEFLPATLGRQDGHGLVLIPAETNEIKPGDLLEFLPF